jgi:hypothetical protein
MPTVKNLNKRIHKYNEKSFLKKKSVILIILGTQPGVVFEFPQRVPILPIHSPKKVHGHDS